MADGTIVKREPQFTPLYLRVRAHDGPIGGEMHLIKLMNAIRSFVRVGDHVRGTLRGLQQKFCLRLGHDRRDRGSQISRIALIIP